MEPLRERHAVLRVVHPLCEQRMADAEIDSAEDLTVQAARVDPRCRRRHREIVDEPRLARFDVDFDLREPDDEGVRVAVPRIRVLRHTHQPGAGEAPSRTLS